MERAKSVRAIVLPRAFPESKAGLTSLTGNDRDHDQREKHKHAPTEEAVCHREHLPSSEPEVLERLGCTAEKHRCAPFVSTLGGQIALGDPRCGAM